MSIREQTIGMSREKILDLLISKLDELNGKIDNLQNEIFYELNGKIGNLQNEIQNLKEWTHKYP